MRAHGNRGHANPTRGKDLHGDTGAPTRRPPPATGTSAPFPTGGKRSPGVILCFRESSHEILQNPVRLIQISAGKPIIKIDSISLMHSKWQVQEMIDLESLHCIKCLVGGSVVRRISGFRIDVRGAGE